MAMTAAVKDEIARLPVTRTCCRKSEVSSILRFAGGLHLVSGRIVIEAEGFENHGTRPALKRDCRRYTGLGARGWVVLRFTWDEVMFEPDYVLAALRETVAVRQPTATNLPTAS